MGICWWIYFWFDALFLSFSNVVLYLLYCYRSEEIQNISYSIPGFSGEMFKFGTIVIQTFVGDLVIKNVEHPDKIYNKLQDAVEISTKKEDINEESIEP